MAELDRDPGTSRFKIGRGEIAGALADLGTFVPLAAALILVNGLDATTLLVVAGAHVILSGAVFGIPWPVQPLKALTALAVALRLEPEVIRAAGLELGAALLLLALPPVMRSVTRAFTRPVVRALQFGVGILLVMASVRLVTEPPGIFRATPTPPWPAVLAIAAGGLVVWAVARGRYAWLIALFAVGTIATLIVAPLGGGLSFGTMELPHPLDGHALAVAFTLLVIPQIPLTLGNAIVAVGDTARSYFGPRAERATATRIALSSGTANVASAIIGGMPMCHGAGGLTAHHRLGARSAGMNLVLGGAFIGAGLLFGGRALEVLGSLPVWVLAAFLAYAGLRHSMLVADLKGTALTIALATGIVGAVLGNLAFTAALAISLDHAPRLIRKVLVARSG